MKRFFVLMMLMASSLCSAISLLAQSLSTGSGTSETEGRREFLIKAIALLDDYEYYSVLDNDESREGFRSLFESDSTMVYNDLLGLSNANAIPVSEYIRLRADGTKLPTVKIKDIRKTDVRHNGEVWTAQCTFRKEMSYTDMCGILLSSKEFYGMDYILKATIVYNEKDKSCKFQKIEGGINSTKRLPVNYSAIQYTSPLDKQVLYNGQHLMFNGYKQALLPTAFDQKKLLFLDPDVTVTARTKADCKRLVKLGYKASRMRLKLHYDMTAGNPLTLDGESEFTEKSLSSYNIGLDYGYVFPGKSKLKIGAFMGLGVSSTSLDLGYSCEDYAFNTKADVDGDTYIRHYQNLKMSQSVKMTDLTIPVYADFDYRFSRIASAYCDLGAQLYINMKNSVDMTDGSAYVYGIYSDNTNQLMNEKWDENGFGNHTFSSSDLDNNDIVNFSKFNASAIGRIGIRVNIPSTPIVVDLGATYELGLTTMVGGASVPLKLANVSDETNAVVYNTISGLNSTEHVRNLTESLNSIKRQCMRINLGVIYKF